MPALTAGGARERALSAGRWLNLTMMINNDDSRDQYDALNQCCASGKVCDAELFALPTCQLDGKTFYKGQKMYPAEDPCVECLCQVGSSSPSSPELTSNSLPSSPCRRAGREI